MFKDLPLNALRAFEATARLGEIKLAAAELFVTPAAVSQQWFDCIEMRASLASLPALVFFGRVFSFGSVKEVLCKASEKRSGDEQGVDLSILDRLDIRLHPDEAKAGAAGRAQVTGWIRLRDGRPPDTLSGVLFADTFPPAVFGLLGVVGWVPTVELTVHVRRRPAPGWLLGQFRTRDLNDGRLIEDGALWDSTGNLVVQSRQLALVRLGERKN